MNVKQSVIFMFGIIARKLQKKGNIITTKQTVRQSHVASTNLLRQDFVCTE